MAIRAILILGAIMLACGSVGLFLVRWTSPMLRGLGYLGVAFAAGSLGAWLLLSDAGLPHVVSALLADTLVLGAYVLLHVAILELMECDSLWPITGLWLLAAQVVVESGLFLLNGYGRGRAIASGLFLSAQVLQTVFFLVPRAKQRLRFPSAFVAVLLCLIAATNTVRSLALLFGYFRDEKSFYFLEVCVFATFVAIALGLGFGVFWMSATALTAGLEHMASTDPLTRAFNRRVFLRWCEKELERNERTGAIFSLLLVDFDHFKTVNDTYGHNVGDEVLCASVEHMQNAIRGIDVLGRWGGEEFVVLLPGASSDAALIVAERLRANIARMRLREPEGKGHNADDMIRMTVSVGVATYLPGEDSLQQMLKRADIALYEAKTLGRNRVVMASPPAPSRSAFSAVAKAV